MGAWKRILVAAVVGTAVVFALTCCESAGSDGDNSTMVYITDEALASGNATTYVVFYIFDNTDAVDFDPGTYDISFDADPGDIISAEVVIGLTDTAIEYAAGTLFTSSFEDNYSDRTIDRYDQIGAGDGTVDVSVSGAEYTFTWNLDVGGGESISGSFTGTQ